MLQEKIFTDFCDSLGITKYQRERRKLELLLWLEEFYEYELINTKPMKIIIKKVLGDYKPLPRKKYDLEAREQLTQEKKEDYEKFTIASLGTEFKPNSQSKIAREAIAEFGHEKYGHIDQKRVTRTYIKEPFYKYGESEGNHIWVWYSNYQELSPKEAEEWRDILKKHRIDAESAANAFYRQEQGEDVSEEKSFFKQAMEEIKENYGDFPVLVQKWKLEKFS